MISLFTQRFLFKSDQAGTGWGMTENSVEKAEATGASCMNDFLLPEFAHLNPLKLFRKKKKKMQFIYTFTKHQCEVS